jgi:PAS domain S-box-containing protein
MSIVTSWIITLVLLNRIRFVKRLHESEDRVRFERQMNSQREFYETILKNVRTGIAVMNGRELRFVYVNPAYQDIIPYVKMVGKTFKEVFPGAVEKGAEELLACVIETGEPRFLHRVCGPIPGKPDAVWDGQVFRVHLSEFGENPVLLVILWDATDQKKTEDALYESEEKYRLLVEQSVVGIGYAKGNQVLFANKAILRIFGYDDPQEFMKIPLIDHVAPSSRPMIIDRFKMIAEGLKTPMEFEYEIIRKDKAIRILSASASHFQLKGETYTQIIAQDITTRKEFERERERLLQEIQNHKEELERRANDLARVNKDLETFSYSVAHDLRAPVRTMIGFSKMISDEYGDKLDNEVKEYIRRIVKSGEKMNELIDDMLSLSKISQQDITLTDVEISVLVNAIVNELKESGPNRKISIIVEDNLRVRADHKLLKIALQNLLGNAWKYTSRTNDAKIEFGSFKKGDCRVYFVKDNGAGFNMSQAQKLFKPFKRLHSEGEFPGTGVGLAIVERVIKRHGGEIWAESEIGKGAAFYFTIGK